MKKVNFSVIFVDTVPARIYLALLFKNGILPESIIKLNRPPPGRKFRLLSKLIGIGLTARLHKRLIGVQDLVGEELSESLLGEFGLSLNDLSDEAIFPNYLNVSSISVSHINDPKLVSFLNGQETKNFLFTGGGLLKKDILGIEGSRFIHIHPGIVPDIKGADGFFWSYLLRGKPGYSVFFMNEGVDTGDILFVKEYDFDPKHIKIAELCNEAVYRGILTYYDPGLRINSLIELLEKASDEKSTYFRVEELSFSKQNPTEGRTFFFMHNHFRNLVINKLKQSGAAS